MSHLSPTGYNRSVLRKLLIGAFTEDQLCNLAFDMGVDYESLPSSGRDCFARELLLCFERSGRIPELMRALASERPDVHWSDALDLPVSRRPGLRLPMDQPRRSLESGAVSAQGASAMGRLFPFLGEVNAGCDAALGDDLEYCGYACPDDESAPSLAIPEVPPGARIAVLRVKGSSMQGDLILDGDYVLVQLMESSKLLRENSLIVTWYLPQADGAVNADEGSDAVPMANSSLRGPTLKRYKGEYLRSNGQMYYRLGRLRDDCRENPQEIKAAFILPLGRVLAIHRVVA